MSECESCGRDDVAVEWVTVAISYNFGPIMHELCASCAESDFDPVLSPIAVIREM